jgi:hypothetical protein
MTRAVRTFVLAIAAMGVTAIASAQQAPAPESFTATATVKKGGATLTAPVTITISRYATEAEFAKVKKAAASGSEALKAALSAMPECGSIQIGERSTPLKWAGSRSTGSGRLVTVATSEPIAHLGAGMPQAKPMAGFDVGIAMLVVGGGEGAGTGELAPGAKVGLDKDGALTIEDYGHTVVWLSGVAAKPKGTR